MPGSPTHDPSARPPRSAERGAPERPERADALLEGLVRLVRDRAADLARPGPRGEEPLAPLREAVEALGHVLEAASLLEREEARREPIDAPAPAEPPPRDHEAPAAEDEPAAPAEPSAPDESEAVAFARLEAPDRGPGTDRGRERSDPRPARGAPEPPRTPPDRPPAGYPPYRDELTGLHSREGFEAVASGELKRCRRHGRLFSLLLFRLPATEDEALRRAAVAVTAVTRASDLAARLAEDTIAVALGETAPPEARGIAERIVRRLEGIGAWGDAHRLALVAHPAEGESLTQLLEAARGQLASPVRRVQAHVDGGGRAP